MKTIYYITRSYPKLREHAGGSSLLRMNAVHEFRRAGFNVIVVAPNFGNSKFDEDTERQIVLIPFTKNEQFSRILQRLGFVEDYLDEWSKNAIAYLNTRVNKEDILFSTTGGELGSVKISSLVKKKTNCFNVVNFRDPINYGNYNGLKRDKIFHVSREKNERKYLDNADLIITSCDTFRKELTRKYPKLESRISNNYFGYIGSPLIKKLPDINRQGNIRIVYGGNFSSTQSPEQICDVVASHPHKGKIELTLIGNYKNYKAIQKYLEMFRFIDKIPHREYSDFISKNADIGFVPLRRDYYKYCFPSKIFEYLNHGLAILGSLPDGDAQNFINEKNYGIAVNFKNNLGLSDAITKLLDSSTLNMYRSNVVSENDQWSMKELVKHTIDKLNSL